MNAILHTTDGDELTAPIPSTRMFPLLLIWETDGPDGELRHFVPHPDMGRNSGHYREVDAVIVTKVAGEKTP